MGDATAMHAPIRIATLGCDTPLPKTRTRYPGYGDIFEALLRAGARSAKLTDADAGLIFSHYQIQENPDDYPNPDDIDAILITGSRMKLPSQHFLSVTASCR